MTATGRNDFYQRVAANIAGDCPRGSSPGLVADIFARHLGLRLRCAASGLGLTRSAGLDQERLLLAVKGQARAVIVCLTAGTLATPENRLKAGAKLAGALAETGALIGLISDGYHCQISEQYNGQFMEGEMGVLEGHQLAAFAAQVLPPAAARLLEAREVRREFPWRGLAVAAMLLTVLAISAWQALSGRLPAPGLPAPHSPAPAASPLPMLLAEFHRADSGALAVACGPAQLLLDTGAQVMLTPQNNQVFLLTGALTAVVRALKPGEEFRVVTSNAVVGVRGTIFRVSFQRGTDGRGITAVEVIEGTVELTDNSPAPAARRRVMNVSAGQAFVAAGGRTPQPAAAGATRLTQAQLAYLYDARELARLAREARAAAAARAAGQPVIPPIAPPGMLPDYAPAELHGLDLQNFRGNGTWRSAFGFRGPVSIAINVAEQKFSGEFTGRGERAGVAGDIAGTFGGVYHGDGDNGSMEGTTYFSISSEKYRQEVQNLSGRVAGVMRNRTITGTFRGEQIDGEFSVTVKLLD